MVIAKNKITTQPNEYFIKDMGISHQIRRKKSIFYNVGDIVYLNIMAKNFSLKIIIALISIILFGVILRAYNLDFPSIGYHNMKENEYLSMAQEMKNTQDFITRRVYFYHAFDEAPTMKIYPQVPMVSYQTLIAWGFFGENMWGPRLINVIFGVLCIIIIFYILHLLFNNARAALCGAFLLAIMPLAVFFSRNLQPDSPALFFMLLGNLLYLKFCVSFKKHYLFLGGISFAIAWVYKSTFIFGIIPFLFCFNFKEAFKKKIFTYKDILNFLLPYSLIIITVIWLKLTNQWEFEELTRVNLLRVFHFTYWKTFGHQIWNYAWNENFAKIPLVLTCIGVFISVFKKKRGLIERYLLGWIAAIILYFMFFSDYLNQHSYYQMPFLTLICAASIYAIVFVSRRIEKVLRKDYLNYLLCIIVGATIPLSLPGFEAMHRTVFFGEDVAGESLREFTRADERVFLRTHCQGYGIARYAKRYMEWPATLEEFKKNEKKFNIKYACFYPAIFIKELEHNDPEFFLYIRNNYRIKEVGCVKKAGRLLRGYLILKKSGNLTQNGPLDSNISNPKIRRIYKIFQRTIPYYSIRSNA
jgi:hypothetical protein